MTHWDLIKKWEEKLTAKDCRAGLMLGNYVEMLYQRGLLDGSIISTICNNAFERWAATHEFVESYKGMMEPEVLE